jgi:acyl-CoA synthetase (AMP-forming)/AMP-acid ligase II
MSAEHIGDLLASAIQRYPERDALVFQGRRWTYGELGSLVNVAAARLTPALRRPGARLALVGQNHPAYVVAYFAAQILGAQTVEIGRDESLESVWHVLRMAGPSVLVTDRQDLAAAAARMMPVESFEDFLSACGEPVASGVAPVTERSNGGGVEASIVFTSGTTGLPKGVVLGHEAILFVVQAVRDYLQIGPRDRYALVLPLSHTYGKSNLLSAVAGGAATVMVDNVQDLPGFIAQLSRERCTLLSVVPFHLNVFVRRGLAAPWDLPSLRAITSSGGALSWDVVRAIGRLLPGVRLFPMYGLTETATRVCYLDPDLLQTKPGSVGQPLRGVELAILGEDGSRLPAGVSGEVAVRGPNLMRGYLEEPELTSRTLVDGWLLTGDLGYLDADGFLFIVGRKKDIVKVAGERISLTEIDEVLASHPLVADAASVGAPDPLLTETVWACIVPKPGTETIDDLGSYCASRLSRHKIPRRFLYVDRIPRTPTGKVRRHLLSQEVQESAA